MDQGNFVASQKDNTQITIIRERERQWSKIRIKASAQRFIRRKSYKSQCAINAVELTLGNVEPIPEYVSNVEEKDIIKDYPENGMQQEKANARVFTLTKNDAERNPSVISGELSISKTPAHVLIDSGAIHSFASPTFIRKIKRSLA